MTYDPDKIDTSELDAAGLSPMEQEGGESATPETGDTLPTVDPAFEATTLASVAEAADSKPDPEAEGEIIKINKELGIEEVAGSALVAADGAIVAEQVMGAVTGSEGIPQESQEVMNALKKAGLYREEFEQLKDGEKPSPQFVAKMITTLLRSPVGAFADKNFENQLEKARVLKEELPFDEEAVKRSVSKKIMDDLFVDPQTTSQVMEIAGIYPENMHEEAVTKLNSLFYFAGSERGGRTAVDVARWRDTFHISDKEYVNALRNYWMNNASGAGKPTNEALVQLGFVKQVGAQSKWAWDE